MDITNELAELKLQTKLKRKMRYTTSRLDKYTDELKTLFNSGATVAELQRWLRNKRVKVVYSTVYRWIAKNG